MTFGWGVVDGCTFGFVGSCIVVVVFVNHWFARGCVGHGGTIISGSNV